MDKVMRITFHDNPVNGHRRKEKVYPLIKLEAFDYDEDTASYTVFIEGLKPLKDVSNVEITKLET